MAHEWITDRLPTEADGDSDGDVRVPTRFGATPDRVWSYWHHTAIVPGQPWWSEKAAERVEVAAPAPAPTRKVVQIAAAGDELYALCGDSTMWRLCQSSWYQLPAIPQPEA